MPRGTSKVLVVDTSVIIKWLNYVNEKRLKQAHRLLDHLEDGVLDIVVPDLIKYEVGNALLKGKQLQLVEAQDALDAFDQLPLRIISLESNQLIDVYELGYRSNITFYDASFLYLAQLYRTSLVTDNPKHQKKVKGVRVIPLDSYK